MYQIKHMIYPHTLRTFIEKCLSPFNAFSLPVCDLLLFAAGLVPSLAARAFLAPPFAVEVDAVRLLAVEDVVVDAMVDYVDYMQ